MPRLPEKFWIRKAIRCPMFSFSRTITKKLTNSAMKQAKDQKARQWVISPRANPINLAKEANLKDWKRMARAERKTPKRYLIFAKTRKMKNSAKNSNCRPIPKARADAPPLWNAPIIAKPIQKNVLARKRL